MHEEPISAEDLALQIEEIAGRTEYAAEGIWFVLQGTDQYPLRNWLSDHISAKELSWRLHDIAILSFGTGTEARQQLADWGLRSTDDFGAIVYALLDANVMQKTDQDSEDEFQNIFKFETSFETLQHKRFKKSRMQWQLSTLLLITTVLSIAFAGAGKSGFRGAIGTLFCTWFIIIGCLHSPWSFRPNDRMDTFDLPWHCTLRNGDFWFHAHYILEKVGSRT